MPEINKIQLRRGTAAAWTSANPVLSAGVPGFESDTNKLKIGDGVTVWTSLPYTSAIAPYTDPFPSANATGTDTYAATLTPSITAYTAGQKIQLVFANPNTGAATINLNGLGPKAITKNGSTALSAGDISAGQALFLFYDGTQFQIQGGTGGITREFQRAFSEDLLFDKHEIEYVTHTLTGDLSFTLAGSGHIVNAFCSSIQAVTFDGIQSISFGAGIVPFGILNGGVPEIGTYYISFLYWNGVALCNFMLPSVQASSGTQLAAPGSLAVVADGENALDISWTNVTGNEGYLIEVSVDGVSGWSTVETTAVDAVTSTITGLSAGNTRFVRATTLGNGTTTLNSAYATAAGSTESGAVDAPEFTFAPAAAATGVLVNQPIVITAERAIRNTDGTALTGANVFSVITLKETNSGGTNIPFSAGIDASKTIITITPTAGYGGTQLVYVAINNVEDNSGNEVTVAVSSTFTTNDYTRLNGTSNFLRFGDILDSLFAANDTFFKLRVTVNNMPLTGSRMLHTKYSTSDNQRSFYWYTTGPDVYFAWSKVGTGVSRGVKWTGALSSGEQELELEYDGSIDTNDGLDRCILRIGGVLQGSKSLSFSSNTLTAIFDSTAQLAFGAGVNAAGTVTAGLYYIEQAKDFQVLSAGDVMELDVPIIIEGTDVSGNARHGTWV